MLFLPGCGESEPAGPRAPNAELPPGPPLIVYCAHDRVYSEVVLKRFTSATGIPVRAKYDTELTKSLGLVEQILAERPADSKDGKDETNSDGGGADVFWNNEPLGMMDLADAGRLEPWKGAAWERVGAKWRDAEGRWVGFAGRVRLWILYRPALDEFKRGLAADSPEAADPAGALAFRLGHAPTLSRVTIADAMFGTTRMHYTVLWHRYGARGVRMWHEDAEKRGVVRSRSNGQTKNAVARGACDAGWTDTDDFFEAVSEGLPVERVEVRVPRDVNGREDSIECWQSDGPPAWTIIVPNAAAIIRGTPRSEQARRFVDWLASEEGETLLANGGARQIPLGPVAPEKLPQTVAAMLPLVEDAYPVPELASVRAECLAWIKSWKR